MKTTIDVKGVIPGKRAKARQEAREYLDLFQKNFVKDKTGINTIIIAGDFKDAINELRGEPGTGRQYRAARRATIAIGRTLRSVTDEAITFTVVIDGGQFGGWEDSEKPARVEIFFHEFIHAWLEAKRFARTGKEGFIIDTHTVEGVLLSLALTRDEYIADSYADEICKRLLTDEENRAVGLAKLNEARGIDYEATFIKLVSGMDDFVKRNMGDFRGQRKSAGQMWHDVGDYIEEILTVFAHLAGSREKEADWGEVKQRIAAPEPYTKYLAGHLKKIYTEWINYFLDGYDEAKSLDTISREIEAILRGCGLEFRNVKGGIYVTVKDAR